MAARTARTAARPSQGRHGAQAARAESLGGAHPRAGAAVAGTARDRCRPPTPHARSSRGTGRRRWPNWNGSSRKSARRKPNSRRPKRSWPSSPPPTPSFPTTDPTARNDAPSTSNARPKGSSFNPRASCWDPRISTGRLGPGNPLDAALRSIREHYAAHRLHGIPRRTVPAADRPPRRHRSLCRRPTGHADVGR